MGSFSDGCGQEWVAWVEPLAAVQVEKQDPWGLEGECPPKMEILKRVHRVLCPLAMLTLVAWWAMFYGKI